MDKGDGKKKKKKLIKNKIANVLHFYRNCKDPDEQIEEMVDSIWEVTRGR